MRPFQISAISAALLIVAGSSAIAAQTQRSDTWHPLRGLEATKALNLLELQGYRNFKDFEQDGKNYDATVTYDEKVMHVQVDPDTGIVMPIG